MKQREQSTIERLVQEGADLSVLDDYVSKSLLAEHISQLKHLADSDREALWQELEATSDVFMPKTKLEAILNSHESQLDELRRLLATRPIESVSARRKWNENLQTFQEVPETDEPQNKPSQRTAMELELELETARRRLQGLDSEVQSLRDAGGKQSSLTSNPTGTDPEYAPSSTAGEDIPHSSDHGLSTPVSAPAMAGRLDGLTPVSMGTNRQRILNAQSPFSPATADFVLDGEHWMLNPKTQDLLHVRKESRTKVSHLREESQRKVINLRDRAKKNPQGMSFEDKMAFFTTHGARLHPDIVNQAVVDETKF